MIGGHPTHRSAPGTASSSHCSAAAARGTTQQLALGCLRAPTSTHDREHAMVEHVLRTQFHCAPQLSLSAVCGASSRARSSWLHETVHRRRFAADAPAQPERPSRSENATTSVVLVTTVNNMLYIYIIYLDSTVLRFSSESGVIISAAPSDSETDCPE